MVVFLMGKNVRQTYLWTESEKSPWKKIMKYPWMFEKVNSYSS